MAEPDTSGPWPASRLFQEYREHEAIFEAAADTFKNSVNDVLKTLDLKPSIVQARHKRPVGLYRKQLRDNYVDPWSECTDIVGVRVVLPLLSQKKEVVEGLKADPLLDVFDVKDKREELEPTELRYAGLHAHLRHAEVRNQFGDPIRCEVQVRTIAEHTWAETEHKYIYKGPKGTTREAKRTFARLLVLVELMDEELKKGVDMISTMDSFDEFRLAQKLEGLFEEVGGRTADFDLTLQTLQTLRELDVAGSDDMWQLTHEFAEKHRDKVADIMRQHGPESETFSVDNDFIVAQPELLLFMAMLEQDEYKLYTHLQHTDLYYQVRPLAEWTNRDGFLVD